MDERFSFAYDRCDVPAGMTLDEYRRAEYARKANERRRWWPLRRRHARSKSR